jgi:hypothetical protein
MISERSSKPCRYTYHAHEHVNATHARSRTHECARMITHARVRAQVPRAHHRARVRTHRGAHLPQHLHARPLSAVIPTGRWQPSRMRACACVQDANRLLAESGGRPIVVDTKDRGRDSREVQCTRTRAHAHARSDHTRARPRALTRSQSHRSNRCLPTPARRAATAAAVEGRRRRQRRQRRERRRRRR